MLKINNVFKKAVLKGVVLFFMPFCSLIAIPANAADAPSININLSSSAVNLKLSPTKNQSAFGTADLRVDITTTNTGYVASMNIPQRNMAYTLPGNDRTIDSLDSNAGGYTEETFTANRWGYRIGAGNFLAIPETQEIASNTDPNNQDSTTITFASKVDFSLPAGDYATDVMITAVAVTPTLTLQSIDTWKDTVAKNQVVLAQDERDSKWYHVGRLEDGNLWILDNLELDLTDSDVLSGLSPTNTNATSTSLTSLRSGNRAAGDKYATAGVSNWTSTGSFSVPLVNMVSKDVVPDNAPQNSEGNNKVGGYYNYCAASAGSYCHDKNSSYGSNGNTTEDICPAGWRMPTGGIGGEYSALAAVIYGSTEATDDATAVANYRSALSLPLAGFYRGSSVINRGSKGHFLSNTKSNVNSQSVLFVGSSEIRTTTAILGRDDGVTVRCIAKRPDVTITYNANGGTGTMAAQTITDGQIAAGTNRLNSNTFARTDYNFNGWNTKADGSGISYSNDTIYSGGSVTLYAQWAGKVTITFDANGGTGTMASQQKYLNESVRLKDNTFTRANYRFNGWNTAADGSGTSYIDGAYYGGPSTTLYAQWVAQDTITFNANGGTGTMTSQKKDSGKTVALKENTFTREGYVFMGWNTQANGSGTSYADKASYSGGSVTLYAQWLHPTATFDSAYSAEGKTKQTVGGVQYYTMQDMSSSICVSVAIGERTKLVDTRDNTIYNVGKMGDGRCWFLDNLALDLTETKGKDLIDKTNASGETISNFFDNEIANYNPFTEGQPDWGYPYVYVSDKDNYDQSDSNGYWEYGVLYNICAASAGSMCPGSDNFDDLTEDICPAGWRLPEGYNYDDDDSLDEYTKLVTSITGENQHEYEGSAVDTIRSALRLPFSPSYSSYGANITSLWTSTFVGATMWYPQYDVLFADTGYLYTTTDNAQAPFGQVADMLNVRCIAK